MCLQEFLQAPGREVLAAARDLDVRPPKRQLVGNVEADFYPSDPEAIRDVLCRQIASPVRWVEGVERLYQAGARAFVEVGPKRALKGFVDEVLGEREGVWSLFANHPKTGELPTFNHALCGLIAAGYTPAEELPARPVHEEAIVMTGGKYREPEPVLRDPAADGGRVSAEAREHPEEPGRTRRAVRPGADHQSGRTALGEAERGARGATYLSDDTHPNL